MAVPSVIRIFPLGGAVDDAAEGHSGGGTILEVYGDGFRVPPDPPATGPARGEVPRTVQVLFGTAESPEVIVLQGNWIRARVPRSALDVVAPDYGVGLVDVTIRNLDDNGDPIGGEEVVVTDGFRYRRPDVSASAPSDLLRVIRTWILEWKRQVIPNVLVTQSTDYDSSTADALNIVDIAETPALVLVGPEVEVNTFYARRAVGRIVELADGTYYKLERPLVVDVLIDVIGVDDSYMRLLNLLTSSMNFVHRNVDLVVDADPDDASKGTVGIEHDFQPGSTFTARSRSNNSNIYSFTGAVMLRGVDLSEFPGFVQESLRGQIFEVDSLVLDVQSLSG